MCPSFDRIGPLEEGGLELGLGPRSPITATVLLAGPEGMLSGKVVAAEGGLLVFITPEAPLGVGTLYTVSLNGLEDTNGFLVPFTSFRFTTAQSPATPAQGTMSPAGGASGAPTTHQSPGATVGSQPVELDEWEWKGQRRDGKPYSSWQSLPPLQAPPGVTALAGQVLRLHGQPLADVTLQIADRSTRTDSTGRFLLTDLPAGRPELIMDGSTANRPGKTYGPSGPGTVTCTKCSAWGQVQGEGTLSMDG